MKACRFCHKIDSRFAMTNYSNRHYAHFECFLDRKGFVGFFALRRWQRGEFPNFMLRDGGFLEEAKLKGLQV